MSAGADTIRMDAAEVALPLTPPRGLVRGILVNRHGQRFINEDTYYGRIGQDSLLRQDGHVYLLVDNAVYERNAVGFEATFVEETIEDLERSAGFARGALTATMELYNRYAQDGKDPVFHKASAWVKPLVSPPFAAIDCRPNRVLWATFTLGGLHTRPAGRTSSGIAAYGYCSGISLGDGTFFGREAGRRAATK
jgi:hypothetical protein